MYRLFALVFACGCANFSVQPAASADAPGIHFFLPKPYLLFHVFIFLASRNTVPHPLSANLLHLRSQGAAWAVHCSRDMIPSVMTPTILKIVGSTHA